MQTGGAVYLLHTERQRRINLSNMAEETVLNEGASFMDPFKGLLLTYFMPESCYDEFFLNFNFLYGKWLVLVERR